MLLTRRFVAGIVLCLSSVFWMPGSFAEPTDRGTWEIELENDRWGNGTDGHYTHGTQLGYRATRMPDWLRNVVGRLPCGPCRDPQAVSYDFGQSIYTPHDTWSPTLVADDRPYAGWLYLGARLSHTTTSRSGHVRSDTIGLKLGVVGPASLAERAQAFVHEKRKLGAPKGWRHQLRNEPGFVLDYTRKWERGTRSARGFGIAAAPYVTVALGNIETYLGGGVMLRTGLDRDTDVSNRYRFSRGLHLFVGLEGRGVVRNVFLDGNTWAESHRVEKRPFVGELQAGVRYAGEKLEISLAQTVRSREFHGQLEPDVFGSISLQYRP